MVGGKSHCRKEFFHKMPYWIVKFFQRVIKTFKSNFVSIANKDNFIVSLSLATNLVFRAKS